MELVALVQAVRQGSGGRLKLLKVGAIVVRNTRRVRLWFSSAFPLQEVFRQCLACFYG